MADEKQSGGVVGAGGASAPGAPGAGAAPTSQPASGAGAQAGGSPSSGVAPHAAGASGSGEVATPEVLTRIEERFPGATLATSLYKGETTAIVDPSRIVEICRFLKDDPGLKFRMLIDLCAIHWMDREYSYEVVYLLHSFARNERVRLKVRLGEEGHVATLTGVHAGANWHEREAFDLVGVVFDGHPDLRRILMPDDYDAFPLRKDFPVKGY
jgi:NADH-quinone oxidoreductase subunit C